MTQDPRVEKPGLVNFKKNNSEVLQSRGQQCRNEAFEWTVVCSHGEEESVYVLENESEKSSCWMKVVGSEQVVFHSFWSNLNESTVYIDETVNNIFQQELTIYHHQLAFIHPARRFAHPEPIFFHSTWRLMHPFGEIMSPFRMDICLFWMVMVPFFWLTWKIQDAETLF